MNEKQTLTEEQMNSLFETPVEESKEETVTEEQLNSLFEDPKENSEEPVGENVMDPVNTSSNNDDLTLENPIADEELFKPNMEITPDIILDAMYELDKNKHSDAVIVANLSILHNVTENMTLDSVREDDREQVDDIVVRDCKFDIYSLDGQIFNVTLQFDTAKDAYLKELNDILNRYRMVQEKISESSRQGDVPVFTLTMMPKKLDGQGVVTFTFPIAFFRVLNDDCVSASMFLQFYEPNIQFARFETTKEERSEMVADVMRETEEGSGGSLFEEE